MNRNKTVRTPDAESNASLRGNGPRRTPAVNAPKDKSRMKEERPENKQPEDDKPSGESRRQVTNQDAEREIFNGDLHGDPLGEKETEGE